MNFLEFYLNPARRLSNGEQLLESPKKSLKQGRKRVGDKLSPTEIEGQFSIRTHAKTLKNIVGIQLFFLQAPLGNKCALKNFTKAVF